jgi:uncharacterized protein
MDIEFDPAKDAKNIADHGVSLAAAAEFEWETAFEREDDRFDYGEVRIVALGLIGSRLHVLVYTVRGEVLRAISLRKANDREVKFYEAQV